MAKKSKHFGATDSVVVDGKLFYELKELAQYFGVEDGTFRARCRDYGLQKAIELRGGRDYSNGVTVDNILLRSKGEMSDYFDIPYACFAGRCTRNGLEATIKGLLETTELTTENGKTKRKHLTRQIKFEDGYEYKEDFATGKIEILFGGVLYPSCESLSKKLNCSGCTVKDMMEKCIESRDISRLKNLDFKIVINGKEVHGMKELYKLYPTVSKPHLCRAIQIKTISKLNEIIGEYEKGSLVVGRRCFMNYDDLTLYLGRGTKESDLRPQRTTFYYYFNTYGLTQALKRYFRFYIIGVDSNGDTIASYKCPICNKTLVVNVDKEERLAHSDEFCGRCSLNNG